MDRHWYRAHGLSIASQLSCPELSPLENTGRLDEADIRIELGDLSQVKLDNPDEARSHYLGEGRLLINIPGLARYQAARGRLIIVDPGEGGSESEIRLFLLGSAMGAILHQRGLLPLHANGVEIGGKCIIFAGHSGQGKSTLAHAFAQRGFRLLSDDLCALQSGEKETLALPGIPHIKLWEDSLRRVDTNPDDHKRVRQGQDKFFLGMADSYCRQALPLGNIYTLHYHENPEIRFQTLPPVDSLIALKRHTYKPHVVKRMNIEKAHLQKCFQLLANHRVTRIYRPRDYAMLDDLIEKILDKEPPWA